MINDYRSMLWRRVFSTLILINAAGCSTKANPHSCNDGICNDQSLPFCDVNGTLGGEPKECIAVDCTPAEVVECRDDVAVTCSSTGNDYDLVACNGRCDLEAGGCVECTSNMECDGAAPICGLDTHSCRGCRSDDECDSKVCDVDTGACVAASEVVYAAPDGTGQAPCALAQPCPLGRALTISLAMPVPAAVRMLPGTYGSNLSVTTSKELDVIATGATLKTTTNPAVSAAGGAKLTIRGLNIDAMYPSTVALTCGYQGTTRSFATLRNVTVTSSTDTGSMVLADLCTLRAIDSTFYGTSSGSLVLTGTDGIFEADRCRFSNTSASTDVRVQGLGERMNIQITNSVFDRIFLAFTAVDPSAGATQSVFKFAFNTFVDTVFDCNDPSQSRMAIRFENNIFRWVDSSPAAVELGSICTFDHNIAHPALVLGGSNRDVDPKLANLATRDFSLQSTSPAIDTAMPSAQLPARPDVNGVARPQGAQADVGAFEFKP